MAYPEINTILRQTINEVTTIHNSAPTIQTIISKDSPTITTIVNGFWDAVWSVNGQTGDVRIEFTFDPFKPNTVYLQNQAIVHNDNIYIAKNSFTSGSTFNEADWNIIGDMANADMVTYNNTETGISATTVQDALDYAIGQVPTDFFKLSTTTISGEGNDITLANTAEVPFKNVVLKGDTFQQTYTGKNLVKVTATSQTIGTITFTVNNDGTIVVNGTNGNSVAALNIIGNNPIVLPAGQYENSGCPDGGNDSTYRLDINNGTNANQTCYGTPKAFTLTSQLTITSYRIRIAPNAVINNLVFKPMIRSTSTGDSTFEPYTGSTPSQIIPAPNPDYPQDINVVTGEQTVEVRGKNLFDKSDAALVFDGYLATGSITLIAQASDETVFIPCQPNTEYTIQKMFSSSGKNRFRIASFATLPVDGAVGTNLGGYSQTDADTHNTATYTTSADAKYLVVFCYTNDTDVSFSQMLDSIQIELGSTATAFVPYQEQSYTVNLGKNLFDKENANTMMVTVGSNNLSSSPNNKTLYIACKPNTTYTVQKRNDGDTNRFAVAATDVLPADGVTTHGFVQSNSASYITITTNDTAKYLVVMYYRTYETKLSEGQILDSIQIEIGSNATSYAPYFTPIELVKIGTYQDYIWKDNGTWKIHKEIGKHSFDGTESWDIYNTGTPNYYYRLNNSVSDNLSSDSYVLMSNYGSGATVYNSNEVQGIFLLGTGSSSQLRVRYGTELTAIEWETKLTAKNMILYYLLGTPTDTVITDTTLIAQLEDLRSAYSYKGQTNISASAVIPNLPFILNADAFLNTTWEGFQSGVGKLAENAQQDTLKKWDVRDNISDGDDKLVTGGGVYDALREIDNNSVAAHNSIVRGKDLTNIYTLDELSAKVQVGDFSDIYVGDYITKKVTVGSGTERELDFVIAHIDYFMHVGDTETTRHHLVMVPDTAFYEYMQMNDTDTTTGGYYGSKGHGICNAVYSAGTGGALTNVVADYTTFQATTLGAAEGTFVFTHTSSGWQYDGTVVSTGNLSTYGITYSGTPVDGDVITVSYVLGYLEPYRQAIYTAFGNDHILAHRTQYSTSTSTSAWHTNRCELMNESMVYGQIVRANNAYGELTENSQLAWFSARPDKRVAMRGKGSTSRTAAWLSSISGGSSFCHVSNNGFVSNASVSSSDAVRPYFLFA